MVGSRRFMFGDAMSIRARRVRDPSSNSPARMRANRSRFSATVRSRQGLLRPGRFHGPRYAETSAPRRSQTYAFPASINWTAQAWSRSK